MAPNGLASAEAHHRPAGSVPNGTPNPQFGLDAQFLASEHNNRPIDGALDRHVPQELPGVVSVGHDACPS